MIKAVTILVCMWVSCNANNYIDILNEMYSKFNESIPVDNLKPMTPKEAKIYWDYHAKLPTYTEGYEQTDHVEESFSVRKLTRKLTNSKEETDETEITITVKNDTHPVTTNKTIEDRTTIDNETVEDNSMEYTDLNIANHSAWELIEDPEEGCGESSADRIIGGTNAALGQYPWIALLGYADDDDFNFQCGGSLISKLYILTAAHCVKGYEINLKIARLGEYDQSKLIDCINGVCADEVQDINIVKMFTHELYNKPPLSNDISLLRLEHPPNYNGWVSPICLPHGIANITDKEIMEVAGWGITNMSTQALATVLQTLKVPLAPLNTCAAYYKTAKLSPRQSCAGGYVGEDSCSGDSGGPLMKVDDGTGTPKYYLYGIVSFGATLCGGKAPAIYTRVDHYLKWILDRIQP